MERARIAGVITTALILTTAMTSCSAPARHPSIQPNPDHVRALTAVLDNAKHLELDDTNPGLLDIKDYNVGDLWKKGIDGSGTTVAVIEGWDDPDIGDAMHSFDQELGLPDPQITTIYPSGNGDLPAQCPAAMAVLGTYGSCAMWKYELRLDVEAVHMAAPYAKILIAATPADSEITDDDASQIAPPEMMQAVRYIAAQHLADVISISDGTGEGSYSYGAGEIHAQDPGPLAAAAAGIPLLVSSGDCGMKQNLATATSQCGKLTDGPETATWDDSPWVTAVGGSRPNLDGHGNRMGSDQLWRSWSGEIGSGAGFSSVYQRPPYQDSVASITGSRMRSVPDITIDGREGTSESSPLLAGVLALATQLNGGPLGPINDTLYNTLGPQGAAGGLMDVVGGTNELVVPSSGDLIAGLTATPGFDVASGWGTIDASRFVPSLVDALKVRGGLDTPSLRAADELAALEHNITLTPLPTLAGQLTYMTATGYLPMHPVMMTIDDQPPTKLVANPLGSVSRDIDPSAWGLTPGPHKVSLTSMLMSSSATFTVKGADS